MLLGTSTCIIGKSRSKEPLFNVSSSEKLASHYGKEEAEGALMSPTSLSMLPFRAFRVKAAFLGYTGRKEVEKRI